PMTQPQSDNSVDVPASTDVAIPEKLRSFASRSASWRDWIEALPALVREIMGEWELTADGPSTHGETALAVPVRTATGQAAMVKIGWPHVEAEHEHLVLRAWAGNGAVRLLRADPRRAALLLERAHARDLTTIGVAEACAVVGGLYERLHLPALPQLHRLSVLAAQWSAQLHALPVDAAVPRRMVERAAALADDFAADSDTDGVLINTDLHYFNVLAADREPWLVIDPKPLSGDPAFVVAPMLWNRWEEAQEGGDVRGAVQERFYTLVDTGGLDEERARQWVIVRMVVNVMGELEDLAEQGVAADAMPAESSEWITTCVSIAKAVDDLSDA
ncbi:MAG: aminoglycoside phosphotransferase family protein, partial [Nocardioidaceae bacterium]